MPTSPVCAPHPSLSLPAWPQVAAKYAEVFQADKTRHLITRLRHNVIRTGLRRIATAYSRISLEVQRRAGGGGWGRAPQGPH